MSRSRQLLKRLLTPFGLRRARLVRDAVRAWRHELKTDAPAVPPGAPPLPPARLVLRVAGTPDRVWFLEGGLRAAGAIRAILADNGGGIESLSAILDFGCGCGRVIRHFQQLPGELHGCDQDVGAVKWCRRHLQRGTFVVNRLEPPLPYRDGQFDLVYALSVFTHLPETMQRPWIRELRRVLVPRGHLIISLHGAAYLDALSERERREFDSGRIVVHEGPPGSNLCAAYHPDGYLRELVADDFTIVARVAEGALGNPRQDLILLRKATSMPPALPFEG